MKKLLSALVMAGLLAGLGCGGDTKTTEKKDGKMGTEKEKKEGSTKDKDKM